MKDEGVPARITPLLDEPLPLIIYKKNAIIVTYISIKHCISFIYQ